MSIFDRFSNAIRTSNPQNSDVIEINARQIADVLKLLSNENRLLIVAALIGSEMSVTEIGMHVPSITQSALSQHLALLRAHGVLDCTKNGQNMLYRIIDHRIEGIIDSVRQQYSA